LEFNRRDILLISACAFFFVGFWLVSPIISIVITFTIFFGVKFFVAKRKSMINKEVGKGICADCGETINGEFCQNCSSESEK